MNHFNAFRLAAVMTTLNNLERDCKEEVLKIGGGAAASAILIDTTRAVFANASDVADELECSHISENIRHKQGRWIRQHPDVSTLQASVEDVRRDITRGLRSHSFLIVKGDRKKYLDQPELFGSKVAKAFPSASLDIAEAGNCLATEARTASVFHLMRAAEFGLRALARDRGITKIRKGMPIDLSTWDEIIRELEKQEAKLIESPRTQAREGNSSFFTAQ